MLHPAVLNLVRTQSCLSFGISVGRSYRDVILLTPRVNAITSAYLVSKLPSTTALV